MNDERRKDFNLSTHLSVISFLLSTRYMHGKRKHMVKHGHTFYLPTTFIIHFWKHVALWIINLLLKLRGGGGCLWENSLKLCSKVNSVFTANSTNRQTIKSVEWECTIERTWYWSFNFFSSSTDNTSTSTWPPPKNVSFSPFIL